MWISRAQMKAVEAVAAAYGWDAEPTDRLRLLLWSLFHYYVRRLR